MKTRFRPTHEILLEDNLDGGRRAVAVMVTNNKGNSAAYTRAEWNGDAPASWERVDGEWLFHGHPYFTPGVVISVRPWRKRVSHGLRKPGKPSTTNALFAD